MSKVVSIFTRRPELTPTERAAAIHRAELELQDAFARFRARLEQNRRTAEQLNHYQAFGNRRRPDNDEPPRAA